MLLKFIDNKKKDYIIKLSDYGIIKNKNKDDYGVFSGIKGSLETIAPELLLKKVKTYESIIDIFSLGIILYQLLYSIFMCHPLMKSFFKCLGQLEDFFEISIFFSEGHN